jgi:hypothetical protein
MRISRSSILVAAAALVATPVLVTSCVVPSPSPGTGAALNAVAAVNATTAWAVGKFNDSTGSHELMERWNGKTWQEVFLPPPIGTSLSAVTAVSGSNVWAVGSRRTLHFGGLGWRSIPNPAGIAMYDVAGAADAAVYGLGRNGTNADSLWLMTAGGWRTVSAIPAATLPQTCDVSKGATNLAVLKAGDVWLVGNGKQVGSNQSCIAALHWNGTAWQSSTTPTIVGASLAAVSARAANDVWAVGETVTRDQQLGVTFESCLALHWNGTTWTSVPVRGSGFLRDVDASGAGVWAVGTALVGSGFPVGMLIVKWDGKALVRQTVQALPTAGSVEDNSNLSGVSVRAGVVTSVGNYMPRPNVLATLTERRNAG